MDDMTAKKRKPKMKKFDREFYIERNKSIAMSRYGKLIDENRRVKGTDIWFDETWILHRGEVKTVKNKKED